MTEDYMCRGHLQRLRSRWDSLLLEEEVRASMERQRIDPLMQQLKKLADCEEETGELLLLGEKLRKKSRE